jgi:hypothetical protein
MERFPVALIQEPTAFTSHDPMEMYNNILVFIVGEARTERLGSRSEMHIFQASFLHRTSSVLKLTFILVEFDRTLFWDVFSVKVGLLPTAVIPYVLIYLILSLMFEGSENW